MAAERGARISTAPSPPPGARPGWIWPAVSGALGHLLQLVTAPSGGHRQWMQHREGRKGTRDLAQQGPRLWLDQIGSKSHQLLIRTLGH